MPEPTEAVREQLEYERRWRKVLLDAPREERRRLYGEAYAGLVRGTERPSGTAPGLSGESRTAAFVLLALDPSARVLEVGAGAGGLSSRLADAGHEVVALEVVGGDEDGWLGRPGLSRRRFDGVEWPADIGTFDAVVSSNVLEHLHPEDAGTHVEQAFAALRSGGVFVAITPNSLVGPHDVSRVVGLRSAEGLHLHEWTFGELDSLVRAKGFAPLTPYRFTGEGFERSSRSGVRCLERTMASLPALSRQMRRVRRVPRTLGLRVVTVRPS